MTQRQLSILLSLTRGGYKAKQEDEVDSTGFVIDAFEAALWSFYNTDTYVEGLLKAVNQRKRLLTYLKRKNLESYKKVIVKLKLRK